ncbi:MAG: DUF4102 domain-containing protein [SAR324 cluster bacterium]|nr:DUF4102 domain-containing protein [SAR324 cluster bacterium]
MGKITSPPCYSEAIIRSLKPNPKTYEITIGQGLFIIISPKGAKTWGLSYRLNAKGENITLGRHPFYSLSEAKLWQFQAIELIYRNISIKELTKDHLPSSLTAADSEKINPFIKRWLPHTNFNNIIISFQRGQAIKSDMLNNKKKFYNVCSSLCRVSKN